MIDLNIKLDLTNNWSITKKEIQFEMTLVWEAFFDPVKPNSFTKMETTKLNNSVK